MPLQRILLRAMLWSLALGALTGVLAVLVADTQLVWRVTGTGLVTALACGILLPVSPMLDRAKSRAAGLVGMGAVIAEYLMALALVWDLPGTFWVRVEFEIFTTMILLAGGTAVAMFLMWLVHQTGSLAAGRLGVCVTGAAFAAFMVATWGRGVLPNQAWWETGWNIFACGGLATISLVTPVRGGRTWPWLGVIGSALGCALWLGDIWIGAGSDPGFVLFVLSISTACVVAHAHLAAYCPLTPGQTWLRATTVAAVIVTAGLVDLLAIRAEAYPLPIEQDLLNRGASAGGILASCGSLALCVLARLNRKVDFEPGLSGIGEIMLVCPRCRKKQTVGLGGAQCRFCRLRIQVSIEEPRCPRCDYLLFGLTGEICPECGQPLADSPPQAREHL